MVELVMIERKESVFMKKNAAMIICILLAIIFTFSSLYSEEVGKDVKDTSPGYTFIKDNIGLRVDDKSCMTQIEYEVIKILNKKGVERFSQVVRTYDSNRQKMDIVLARIVQENGKTVPVLSTGIQDINVPALKKSSLYSNLRMKVINFPELKPNDTIEFRIETKSMKPYPEDAFFETSFTKDYGCLLDTSFFVEFPKGRKVNYLTPGHNGLVKPRITQNDGKSEYFWQFFNVKPIEDEEAMPSLQELSSKVMVSSFMTWDDVGKFFNMLASPHLKLSGSLKEKLDQVIGDATGEERLGRIFSWICKDKDIIDLSFAMGGYDFYDVSDVYNEKIISGRDFAVLLLAVLREKNIEAYPVLVNSMNMGGFDKGFPSIQQFDDILVLVNLGDKSIWIEPSDFAGTIGQLSSGMQGRSALVVKNDKTDLIKTPCDGFQENREEVRSEAKLNEDGSLEGVMKIKEAGAHKIEWLRMFGSINEKDKPNLARILISQIDPLALLIDYNFRDNALLPGAFTLKTHFRVSNFVNKTDNMWDLKLPIVSGGGMKELLSINPSKRVWPIVIGSPFLEDRRFHLKIPEGYSVKSYPKDIYIQNPEGSFQVVCNVKGNEIWYQNRLITKRSVIPKDGAGNLLEILNTAEKARKDVIRIEKRK